jgi:hypothetical protein
MEEYDPSYVTATMIVAGTGHWPNQACNDICLEAARGGPQFMGAFAVNC